jgi:hypothetical protein
MADKFKLNHAKDSVYSINNYLAINGLQRFQYRYSAREQDIDEIGNPAHVATVIDPETSGSFEITDTGSLANMFARMRYDYSTQSYMATGEPDVTSSEFSFDEDDLQYMIFDLIEHKRPGGTFSEAKIIPFCTLNRFGIRLNSDNVGSITMDWTGNLLVPVYKPYHQVQSYPAAFLDVETAVIDVLAGATTTTHGILGGMVNNVRLRHDDLAVVVGVGDERKVALTVSGLNKVGGELTDEDRIMLWLYAKTPNGPVPIGYGNEVKFVRPDRIDIWLVPQDATIDDTSRLLRCQSVDITGDVPRDELKEILRNEERTSTFYRHARFPLEFNGTLNILEETLHRWAELQGKTLNETASSASVDDDNVLDAASWVDCQVVARWYKYGSNDPIQELTLGKILVTGLEGSIAVGGRKEQVWTLRSDGSFNLEGFDVEVD